MLCKYMIILILLQAGKLTVGKEGLEPDVVDSPHILSSHSLYKCIHL